MIGQHDRYTCVICGLPDLTSQKLTKHVQLRHGIGIEEYCWRYVEGRDDWPRCSNAGCTKDAGKPCRTAFYRLAEIRKTGSAFFSFCSVSCKMKIQCQDPVAKERNRVVNNAHRVRGSLKHHQYRKEHEGRSRVEDLFWNNDRVRALGLKYDDRRFWHGHHGGYAMDFSLPKFKLCIELDGDSHKDQEEYDKHRDEFLLKNHGWNTLRFSNEEVKTDINSVVDRIYEYILLYGKEEELELT